MTRRSFILRVGSAALIWPVLGRAQPSLPPKRIAIMAAVEAVADIREDGSPYWSAFLGEMRRLGWIEGTSLQIDRWSANSELSNPDNLLVAHRALAARPAVTVVFGFSNIATAASVSSELPVVAIGTFPANLRSNLAHPVKNVTGVHVSSDNQQLFGKQLEFLRDSTRRGGRIAWLGAEGTWKNPVGESFRVGAMQIGVNLEPVMYEGAIDEGVLRKKVRQIASQKFDAVLVSPSTGLFPHRAALARMLLDALLPSMSFNSFYAEAGIEMSYGADFREILRRIAQYTDKLLRGARPADLPIEQPAKTELVLNLNTVRALGHTIPQSVLVRADRVIE